MACWWCRSIWSGYLPILLFRHIGGHMLRAVRLNMSLFYHRNVTPFDAVFARIAVEIIGNYGAAVFSFFLLYSIGQMEWPRDMPMVFARLFLHDLVVRVGGAGHRRIQRTHRHFRKGVVAGVVHVSAGFRLFLYGCVDAGVGCGKFC